MLASAATHATWNAGLKRSPDPAASAAWIVAGAASLSGLLAVGMGAAWLPVAAWPWVVGSAAVEAVYFVTLSGAMARLPLGTAYGVARGGGQLVTWPISVLLMHEAVTPVAAAGAALVTAGLLASARPDGVTPRGIGWALACAVAIGIYPVTYKAALAEGAPEAALFAASLSLSLPLQVALLGTRRRSRLADVLAHERGWLAVAAALCAVSFLSFLAALSLGGAGRASAIRNTSVLFALCLGARHGDRPSHRAIAGAVAIAVGAALVAG